MTPLEFVVHDGDSDPNLPLWKYSEAMSAEILIRDESRIFEVASYYFLDGRMVLELYPVEE